MAQTSTLAKVDLFPSSLTSSTCNNQVNYTNVSSERIITLSEVSWHDNNSDCWIIIYDRVYDITDFLEEHPGGRDVLIEHAGRDATIAFRGTGHSAMALKSLEGYLVGELPLQERIFRKPDGYSLSGIPK